MKFENLRAKRWPFVESPGDFTERLRRTQLNSLTPLAAMRQVMIEDPPTVSAEYLAIACVAKESERKLSYQGKIDLLILACMMGWILAGLLGYALWQTS